MKRKVVIDTDVAIGHPERDVDDALAIIMALNSSQIKIAGITLSYGNESLENVRKSMNALSAVSELDQIPIASGACSSDDLGNSTEATALLEEICGKEPVTILCLGPLTNLATFVRAKPDIAANIQEVICVAGRRRGQRFRTGNFSRSHPDLNFEKDPQAMEHLLSSRLPIVFAPYEVSSKVWITETILELIRQNQTPAAEYLFENCRPWLEFWKRSFSTPLLPVSGFNPFDCLAVAWLTDRELLSWYSSRTRIEEADYDLADRSLQGKGGKKEYLHVDDASSFSFSHPFHPAKEGLNPESRENIYIFDVEREDFLKRLVARLK